MPVLAQTELEAINSILSAGGDAPVAALGTTDSDRAELILDEVNREVQTVGWWFNTRPQTLAPVSGEITMPTAVIRVDSESSELQYGIRSGKLYNLVTGLDNGFTGAITIDTVELIQWTDLPEVARNYMQKKAAQLYLERFAGDTQMADRAARTAEMARGLLMRQHTTVINPRIFGRRDRRAVDRRNVLDRINY